MLVQAMEVCRLCTDLLSPVSSLGLLHLYYISIYFPFTVIVTILLNVHLFHTGISCPRAPRDDATPGDAYGQQALMYTKELVLQREVCMHSEIQCVCFNFWT